jgi:hypothetical protein
MCLICDHPQRTAIDRAIVAGDSCRTIASMFATSKDAVYRHKNRCMHNRVPALAAPLTLPVYQTSSEVAISKQNVRSVAQRAASLVDKMEELARRFEEYGDTNGILKAAKEIREGLRLLAQLSGEISPGNTAFQVNVNTPSLTSSPEWKIFVKVIEQHPEIKDELLKELHKGGF